MTFSMNVDPKFCVGATPNKSYYRRKIKNRKTHFWTKEDAHKVMVLYERGFTVVEIIKKLGSPFTQEIIRGKIRSFKKVGYHGACPTCGQFK